MGIAEAAGGDILVSQDNGIWHRRSDDTKGKAFKRRVLVRLLTRQRGRGLDAGFCAKISDETAILAQMRLKLAFRHRNIHPGVLSTSTHSL